ncbi:TMV resistance protein N-like isoform X1 [Bidens hawaiensis]|uniref:TMV resistance protein N-like isoform X1 n=1 Tax=Bidens hawaiensis TaxID=980011 RepID=UPI00404973AE
MGGSGKTTLAKHIFYSNKHDFVGCCFLEEIGNQPNDLLGAQNKLLRDISRNNNMMISDVYEGAIMLLNVIQKNRMLIVVDDIDDKDKLSTLFGTEAFHTPSKIIITTRTLNIDTWFGSISWRCNVHEIELLNPHESLELLSLHAFGSKFPMEDFEELAVELAQYCGGNPLALKVLGSSLPVRAQDDHWTRNNMIQVWKSRMNSLNSLKGDLDCKIQRVLHKSFESLPNHSLKELFLHIAGLLIREFRYEVEEVLENDMWHAKYGVTTLINRCLVTESRDGRLQMHKLLQDMASQIVYEESNDLAKHSRVWRKDDAYRLLRKGDGSERIEGLLVDMQKPEQWMTSKAFHTSSLVMMKNLKLLQLNSVKLIGTYENFPDLIWLRLM